MIAFWWTRKLDLEKTTVKLYINRISTAQISVIYSQLPITIEGSHRFSLDLAGRVQQQLGDRLHLGGASAVAVVVGEGGELPGRGDGLLQELAYVQGVSGHFAAEDAQACSLPGNNLCSNIHMYVCVKKSS